MAHDCAASLLASDSGAVSRTSLSVHTQTHVSDTGRDFLFQGPPLPTPPPLRVSLGGQPISLRRVFPSLWPCWGARRQSRWPRLWGVSHPGTLDGQQDFTSLRDWRAPATEIYTQGKKCFIQISAQLHQRAASPAPFSAFSLLFLFVALHSVQYSVWGVYLSSHVSCWAVNSRRAGISSCSPLWPQHSECLLNKYELNEWLPVPRLPGPRPPTA